MELRLAAGLVVASRYRLEQPLGGGGMGQVWAATHTITGKSLALKFVRDPQRFSADAKRRFVREARAAASVRHPNVVDVIDVVELDEGLPVLVMERLFGETLAKKLLRERALEFERVAQIMLPVIEAVGTAHAAGIVHRDLKPDNIFLIENNGAHRVKVLDFGIAKLIPSTPETVESALTTTGAILGTPYYMAPEQCFGERDVDHRVDVWALGVVLYECLAGERPLVGENFGQILKLITIEKIPELVAVDPKTPPSVLALVDRMLSKDRRARPEDLREVFDVISGQLSAPRRPAPFGPARPPPEPSLTHLPAVSEPKPSARVVLSDESVDAVSTTENQRPSGPTLALSEPRPGGKRRQRTMFASAAAITIMSISAIGLWWRSSQRDRSKPNETLPALSSSPSAHVTPPQFQSTPEPAAPASAPVPAAPQKVADSPRQTVAITRHNPAAVPTNPAPERAKPEAPSAGAASPVTPSPGASAPPPASQPKKGLIENPLF